MIHDVRPWGSQFRIEEYSKGVNAMENLQNHKKNSRKQEITWVRQRNKITERSWTPTSMTRSTKCTHTSNDTRNPTWKSLTIFVSSSGERACFRETHAWSYIPTKQAATPWRPKNKVNKKVLWESFSKNKTKNF